MHKLIKDFLPDLNTEQLNSLLKKLPDQQLIELPKGYNIYYKGQDVRSIFLIKSGLVRIYDCEDRQEVNVRFLCDASVVMPFYAVAQKWQLQNDNASPHTATDTAECITPCAGYKLPLEVLDNLGEWGDRLKLELALRHYLSMEERIRMLQLKTAAQRYQLFLTTMPKPIIANMPSLHVASYLGMSAETLSRVKSRYHANDNVNTNANI